MPGKAALTGEPEAGKLLLGQEFVHFVFVDHYFLVGVFSSSWVFYTLYDFYEVPSGSGICGPLGNPRVFRYLCHDYLISL